MILYGDRGLNYYYDDDNYFYAALMNPLGPRVKGFAHPGLGPSKSRMWKPCDRGKTSGNASTTGDGHLQSLRHSPKSKMIAFTGASEEDEVSSTDSSKVWAMARFFDRPNIHYQTSRMFI